MSDKFYTSGEVYCSECRFFQDDEDGDDMFDEERNNRCSSPDSVSYRRTYRRPQEGFSYPPARMNYDNHCHWYKKKEEK